MRPDTHIQMGVNDSVRTKHSAKTRYIRINTELISADVDSIVDSIYSISREVLMI